MLWPTDPFVEREGSRSGVQHDPGDEAIAQPVA
jgi:hypothetical protein